MTQTLNVLELPLHGFRAIEASAGTGKTWTLSALYVRLVLGHGLARALNPPQILVMTFTELATAELRGRIRERLYTAAQYFHLPTLDAPSELKVDDFLIDLKDSFNPEHWVSCAKRLELSAQWMDEAAIFTIHGWSARMLKEHAFDSKSLFEQSLVDDTKKLKTEAAQSYWRKYVYPLNAQQLQGLKDLKGFPSSPQDLLDKLRPFFSKKYKTLDADVSEVMSLAPGDYESELGRWRREVALKKEAFASDWTREFIGSIKVEIDACKASDIIQSDEYTPRKVGIRLGKIVDYFCGKEIDTDLLRQFSASQLQRQGWSGANSIAQLRRLDEFCALLSQAPSLNSILAHAAQEIDRLCELSKKELGQFDFSDLLENLYKAVYRVESNLAQTIREQYPFALVDEFQDTDPWQYGTLKKIYVEEQNENSGLLIIGDPKQAIYGFRGADLGTYLRATRDAAEHIYTLSGNYRSSQALVSAVNHIFLSAENPFDSVSFTAVQAHKKITPLSVDGRVHPALTVWYSKSQKPLSKEKYKKEMASLFASQMVGLLNNGAAQPNEMAVIVRDAKEAVSIRQALARLGVRSVYLSDQESVYACEEAFELRVILKAIANPKSTPHLRSAVATRIWSLSYEEIEELTFVESNWDETIERFHRYQKVWQRQGFLPMLRLVLHENQIAQKLLSNKNTEYLNGERILTNLLHLGDLLQAESLRLHGEGALIRYLERQLKEPKNASDSSIMRLESEANLVKVLTIHKSKGLQFPLVFLPFISNFKVEDSESDRDDKSRLNEDIRLLYVALTRAERAQWMGLAAMVGDFPSGTKEPKSALSSLLRRQSYTDLESKLDMWRVCPDINVMPSPEIGYPKYQPPQSVFKSRLAATPKRVFNSNWWIASFSSISKGAGQTEGDSYYQAGARDDKRADSQQDNALNETVFDSLENFDPALPKAEDWVSPYDAIPSSSAFGTLLHDLLEWQFNNAWPISSPRLDPVLASDWTKLIERKSLKVELSLEERETLQTWIKKIVETKFQPNHVDLPLNTFSLMSTSQQNAWAEMGFTFPVNSLSVAELDALISSHVLKGQQRPAMQARQLNGMLTGFMDLVFEDNGRYYVVDYKSNKLKGYEREDLNHSILSHRYDCQFTLYLVALHRLLKSRLKNYDYDRHVGGAIYLFLRGVDSGSQGLFVERPPKALITAIDEAFRGGE